MEEATGSNPVSSTDQVLILVVWNLVEGMMSQSSLDVQESITAQVESEMECAVGEVGFPEFGTNCEAGSAEVSRVGAEAAAWVQEILSGVRGAAQGLSDGFQTIVAAFEEADKELVLDVSLRAQNDG